MATYEEYQKELAQEGIDANFKTHKATFASTATGSFNQASTNQSWTIGGAGQSISNVTEIALGSGADSVSFDKASNLSLNLGSGNDEVNIKTFVDGNITTGKGDSTIKIGVLDPSTITLGEGSNTVNITSTLDSTINGGAGRDTIYIDSILSGSVIDGGANADSISIKAYMKESTVYGGAGADEVILSGGGKDALVDLGDDNDLVTIKKLSTAYTGVSVAGGSGKDTFLVSGDASGAVITDFDVNNDVLAFTSTVTANVLKFASEGVISNGGSDSISVANTNGYYAVNVSVTGGEQIVAWTSEDGAVVDGRSQTKNLILDGSTNDDVADTLMGGSKADTITTGAGDVAFGAAGNDGITFTASKGREYVALNAESGKDTVSAFETKADAGSADDADVVYLFEDGLDSLRLSDSGTDIVVKDGKASLTLTGKKGTNETRLNVMDSSTTVTEVDYVTGTATAAADTDEMSGVYYSGSKTAKLDFGAVNSALVVDLDNRNIADLTNTNDAIYYGTFASVKGGADDTVLMGTASGKETLDAGTGSTTLWGGGSKADSLVHTVTSATNAAVFFYNAGDGKDSVNSSNWGSEDENDILWLGGDAAVTKVKGTSGGATITLADNADKLTLNGLSSDKAIKFSTDGATVQKAKIGSGSNTTWTYEDGVKYYVGGGKSNTLNVKSDVDTAEVWLDNSHGVNYEGVKTVDASANTGSVTLVGSAANERLVAGKGDSSVWGGTGNDTLVGNSTGVTEFYFGKGNGKDVISKSSADDKVVLFDVALSDVADATYNAGTMKISLTDGSTLTVQNMGSSSVNTFQLNDGSKWTYNTSSKSWSQA